jgi:hypothetical protein
MNNMPKKIKTPDSYQHEKLIKDLERLRDGALQGNSDAQLRYDTILRLVDPTLDFSYSDLQRILNKGHSPQVQKGLRLYRMMQQLTLFVEPIGENIGTACRVRLIPFEKLTWEMFLDTRFPLTGLHLQRAIASKREGKFNGLTLLNNEERKLLKRLKPYFGQKKRPTLQSLAMSLLNEEGNGKGFSERTLYHYRDAVREHGKKNQTTTATSFSLTLYSVDSFGIKERKTVRELLSVMQQSFISASEHISRSVKEMMEGAFNVAQILHQMYTFTSPAEQIARILQSFKASSLMKVTPIDFSQIIANIVDRDFLPRINQYRKLQG